MRSRRRSIRPPDASTPQWWTNNRTIFSNIRLWDWRALDAVYKQFQEIRLYYEFDDVDVDRYTIDDDYRQVMVSAREMELANLPEQSQTFVNRRFKYTHGYGITMTNVSEFTSQGLPDLLIQDIPPKSRSPRDCHPAARDLLRRTDANAGDRQHAGSGIRLPQRR